ncbi:MAG: PilX N-terminal domain-containing pilus assembly protein [Hydrogenophaga sp.]|uniref:pilus assembly PilX family protein n=1 Tax=Hydrogenophaga sp. TaxID=1904254 RepID=UPI0027370054|nr:PilX N-terminal domain-containing pilus assembly protein [Hydrogenophaga sp.]MDP3348571.1 PilX N-terminal domain-containing pilus assembly protein [Hydrogenophaga sp.]
MKPHATHCLRQREQGFSLITTLVLLVIASLLGVAASQLVLMSERSSRYDRDRLIAFQAAEAALLDAEMDIRGPGSMRAALFSPTSITGFEDGCSNAGMTRGMCLPASLSARPVWSTVSFTDTTRTVAFGDYTGRKYAAGESGVQPARPPRYLIEVIQDLSPGSNVGAQRHMYRVSAVGFGPREETQVMLQMFFRKE